MRTQCRIVHVAAAAVVGLTASCAAQAADVVVESGAAETVATASIGNVSVGVGGTLRLAGYDTFRFDITASRNGGYIAINEIVLTCDGVPIPRDCYGTCTVDSQASDSHLPSYLIDNSPTTGWACDTAKTAAEVIVQLSRIVPVNGYQLVASGSLATTPRTWDVYASADGGAETLVDRRVDSYVGSSNGAWTGFQQNQGTNFSFNQVFLPVAVESESISGSGNIVVGSGRAFSPASVAGGWTGFFLSDGARDLESRASVVLPAGEHRIASTNASAANISFEAKDGVESAVVLDDSYSASARFCGRLADGGGKIGLVKRGAGTLSAELIDADFSGRVSVEAGRLRIVGAMRQLTSRYVRITPIRNGGWVDTYGYNWSLNEFMLLDASGSRVAFPAGTSATGENGLNGPDNLIDGNTTTRCLVNNADGGRSGYVTITMPAAVTFSGYCWYTANAGDVDRTYRRLREWRISVSDDGTEWTDVSHVNIANDTETLANVTLRGPYGFSGDASPDGLADTLPPSLFADASARATRAAALKARHFRFAPFDTQKRDTEFAFGWQISEFSLYRNGARVDWSGATATLCGGSAQDGDVSVARVVDNDASASTGRFLAKSLPSYIDIDAGTEVEFDAYGFSSCGDNHDRSPSGWRLFVSADGTSWHCVDVRQGVPGPSGAWQSQGPWSVAWKFPLLRNGGGDAIGDAAEVSVLAGAELELSGSYERIGSLAGAGKVILAKNINMVLDLNPSTNGVFSGTVEGGGTLCVSGGGLQRLSGADLSGVRLLELDGGGIAGSASFGGNDLNVAFGGGSLWGEMSGIGMLSVSGTPRIALPEDTRASRGASCVLVSASGMSAEVQAAFRNAVVVKPADVPESWKVDVEVTSTTVKVSCCPPGFTRIIR